MISIRTYVSIILFLNCWLPVWGIAQTCPPNIDFEYGNFTNWQCYTGSVKAVGTTNQITVTPSAPTVNRHTIITAATLPATDPYGGFPVLCPNGSTASVRLGNSSVGAQAERISYTFSVPNTTDGYSLVYQYAVVLEDPNHQSYEQPRFTAKVFDITDNKYIDCASFEYVATSALPGFKVSPQSTRTDTIWYKPWSSVTINLSGYGGKQIRLEFTTADCTKTAHFGYAYVDVNTGCTTAITGLKYCTGAPYVTLQGPAGFLHYKWYKNNFTTLLGTSQALTLTPPPPGNTPIMLAIEPYTGFGCVDTLYTTIRENPAPTPNAGADQVICSGSFTQIGTPATIGHSYFWFPINKVGAQQSVNPTTPTTYILYESIDSSGCKRQDTVKVTPVTVDTTLRVTGNLVTCRGQSPNVQLQVNTGYTAIKWVKDNVIISGATSNTYTATAAGTYFAIVSNQTCNDSTRSIKLTVAPAAQLAYNINTTAQCLENNNFNFANTSTTVSNDSLRYLWQFGDGGTATNINPTHSYTTAGAYWVKLITTNNLGCKDTLIKPVNVNPMPVAAYNVATQQCMPNSNFSFTNVSTVSSGTISTYDWNFGDAGTSAATSPAHSYVASGTYNVRLIAISNSGCRDTITKPVTINPKPAPAFAISTPNQCISNNSFSFTNSSTISSGTLGYSWTFGDGATSVIATPVHSYTSAGQYNVKLIVTSNNGCKDSVIQPVNVYAKPTVAFTVNGLVQCLGNNNFTFTNNSSISAGTTSSSWTFGDGGNSTTVSPSHTYTTAGSYPVRLLVTSNYGCKDSSLQTITVNAKPAMSVAFNTTAQCVNGNNFSFTNNSSISAGTLSYIWTFGDGGTSTLTSPGHVYAAAGTYFVKVIATSNSGCKDSSFQSITVYTKPAAGYSINGSTQCQKNNNFSFNNSSTISAGTIAYSWTFGDGGTSTTTSPSHAYTTPGTYPVKLLVTSNNGCKDSSIQSITVNASPIMSVAFNTTAKCLNGNNFSFINSSTIAAGTLYYAWAFGDGDTSIASSPTHVYTAAGNYIVKVIATSNNGCKDSAQQNLTVYAKPTVGYTINGSIQCQKNNNFTFNNSSAISAGTIAYSWTFGDGGSSTTTSPTHAYSAPGTYPVKLLAISNNGCKDSSIQNIVVNASPAMSVAFNTTPQCLNGNNFSFTNNTTISVGTLNYAWAFGDGGTSIASSPTHTYSAAGTYIVKVIATSNNGCKDSAQQILTVYSKPSVVYTINGSTQCQKNNNFSFNNSSTISAGTIAYSWTFGDGGTSTTTSPAHAYTTPGTYPVKLLVTSNNGCKDSSIQNITVNASPTMSVAFNTTAQCLNGNNFSFTNNSTISFGSLSYAWTFGDGGVSTLSSPTHVYAAAGTYFVKVIATSSNGCKDSSIQSITIYAKPTAGFTPNNGNQCINGNSFTFTNSSTILSGTLGYNWSFGDGGTSTVSSPAHNYTTAGTYLIKLLVTSNNGCKDSSIQSITVNAKPTVSFSPNTASQCLNGNSFTFTNTSSVTSGTLSYNWNFGDSAISTLSNPAHSYNASGNYLVKLVATTNSGCKDSTTFPVTVYPKPSVAFNVAIIAQCIYNNSFSFTNSSSISSGSVAYLWNFGDGNTSGTTNPSHSYSAVGTFPVSLLVTSNNGCKDSLAQTATILPKPTAAFSTNNPAQCVNNNNFTFTNNSALPSGTFSSAWNFGDGGTSSSTNTAHTFTAVGTYNVKLVVSSTTGSCLDSLSIPVSINPKPTVNVAWNTAGQCFRNNTFTFNNTSTISAGTLTYSWDFGDSQNSSATSPTHSYSASGTYNVHLLATSNNGCKDSSSNSVLVYPQPTASFTVNNAGQCISNNNFTFNNTSAISSGTLSNTWNFGDGNGSTAANPSHTYATAGTYAVKLISLSANSCADTTTTSVTVYARPSSTFNFNNGAQCVKGNRFFFNPSNPATGVTYQWTLGDGSTATSNTTIHSYTAAGTYNVTLLANGTACKDSTTQPVTVYPNPSAAFNANSSATCLNNNNFSFTNNTALASGTYTSLWNFGDNTTSSLSNPSHQYTTPATFNAVLITTSDKNCHDTARQTITVNASPKITLDIPTQLQCLKNNSFTFSNTTPSAGLAYNWSFGDGSTSTLTTPSHSYAAPGDYRVNVKASFGTGCTDTTSQMVSVVISPKAGFSVVDTTQCLSNNKFLFTNTSTPGIAAANYLWMFGDGNGSNQTNVLHSYLSAGTYNVSLIVFGGAGCKDTIVRPVNVKTPPTGSLTLNTSNICEGDSALLTATGGVKYIWYKDGVVIPGATIASYYATTGGNYSVDVLNAEGCAGRVTNSVAVRATTKPSSDFTYDRYCIGTPTHFINNSNNVGTVYYRWTFPDGSTSTAGNPYYTFTSAGTFNVMLTATAADCRKLVDSTVKTVVVESGEHGIRYPTVGAVVSVPKPLKAREIGTSYYWSPGNFLNNNRIADPTYTGDKETQYTIAITQRSGCIVVDTLLVTLHSTFNIFVPDAFSPNHDGANDYLFPFLVGDGELISFKVINRWGIVVFQTNTEQPGWDGQYKGLPQPVDGYVWEAQARDRNGNVIRRKGTVTLVR